MQRYHWCVPLPLSYPMESVWYFPFFYLDQVSLKLKLSNLTSTAALSYTLGLRHALDADHISV